MVCYVSPLTVTLTLPGLLPLGLHGLDVAGEVEAGLDPEYPDRVGVVKRGLRCDSRQSGACPWPSPLTSRMLKYCAAVSRSSLQSDLNPISSMLGDSLPRPASVRQEMPPSSKLLFSVTV